MVYFDSPARTASVAGVLRDLGWRVQVQPTPEGSSLQASPLPCKPSGTQPSPHSAGSAQPCSRTATTCADPGK